MRIPVRRRWVRRDTSRACSPPSTSRVPQDLCRRALQRPPALHRLRARRAVPSPAAELLQAFRPPHASPGPQLALADPRDGRPVRRGPGAGRAARRTARRPAAGTARRLPRRARPSRRLQPHAGRRSLRRPRRRHPHQGPRCSPHQLPGARPPRPELHPAGGATRHRGRVRGARVRRQRAHARMEDARAGRRQPAARLRAVLAPRRRLSRARRPPALDAQSRRDRRRRCRSRPKGTRSSSSSSRPPAASETRADGARRRRPREPVADPVRRLRDRQRRRRRRRRARPDRGGQVGARPRGGAESVPAPRRARAAQAHVARQRRAQVRRAELHHAVPRPRAAHLPHGRCPRGGRPSRRERAAEVRRRGVVARRHEDAPLHRRGLPARHGDAAREGSESRPRGARLLRRRVQRELLRLALPVRGAGAVVRRGGAADRRVGRRLESLRAAAVRAVSDARARGHVRREHPARRGEQDDVQRRSALAAQVPRRHRLALLSGRPARPRAPALQPVRPVQRLRLSQPREGIAGGDVDPPGAAHRQVPAALQLPRGDAAQRRRHRDRRRVRRRAGQPSDRRRRRLRAGGVGDRVGAAVPALAGTGRRRAGELQRPGRAEPHVPLPDQRERVLPAPRARPARPGGHQRTVRLPRRGARRRRR